MNKLIKLLPLLVLPLFFNSCKEDKDEPVNIDDIKSSAIITTNDGEKVLLSKMGSMLFSYNDNGMPVRVDDWEIDYEKRSISYVDEYEDSEREIKFSINNRGHFTQIVENIEEEYDGEISKEKITANISYSGDGYLTKIALEGSFYEGNFCVETWNYSLTYTWNGKKLTNVNFKGYWKESERDGKETSVTTGNYETNYKVYADIDNPLRQYSGSMMDMTDTDEGALDALFICGLLGYAPSNLPTKIIVKEFDHEDGEEDYETEYEWNYRYEFNDNGTIYNQIEDDRYNCYYKYTNYQSRAVINDDVFVSERKNRSVFNNKGRHHQRHIERKMLF